MKNYEIKKTSAPNIFTLYDEDKKPVADIRGKALAEEFAALPEKMILFDIMVATLNEVVDNDGAVSIKGIEEFLTHNNLRK